MPRPTEIEVKLAVVAGDPAKLRRGLRGARVERSTLRTLYFDTPDERLRQRGMVLRLRRDGDRWIQTLKTEDPSRALAAERGEWEADLGLSPRRPSIDVRPLAATPLQTLVDAGLAVTALVPVFETRFVRHRATIRHRHSSIEVAVDRGELHGGVARPARRRPFAEVELELKSGRAEDLLHLARRWIGGSGPVLVPALRSKAERAHALARGEPLAVARASASGFTPQVAAGATSGRALRAVVRHALGIVVANADALRDGGAAEHVHQARVALRRLRSAVRLLDPDHDDFPKRLVKDLRWLARVLGQARDWDVLVETTLPAVASAAVDGIDAVQRRAGSLRARAHRKALDAICSRRYARLAIGIGVWAQSAPPVGHGKLAEAAPALADAFADAALGAAKGFADLSRPQQHRVRIRVKRLRYALDLLRPCMPREAVGAYIDALGDVQDRLGELNDAEVAWDRLRDAGLSSRALRSVRAWHQAVEPELVRKAARDLAALARRNRPWRDRTPTARVPGR